MQRGQFELNYDQLYLDAKNAGAEERMEDELYSFTRLLRSNYDFKLFLEDPRIAANYKKEKVQQMCPPGITSNFLAVIFFLIEHGREEMLGELSRFFTRSLFKEKGMLFGEVESVCEIPAGSRERLNALMENLKGRPVKLRYSIDPELIGGLSVKFINGEIWDASIRHKLADLKAHILK